MESVAGDKAGRMDRVQTMHGHVNHVRFCLYSKSILKPFKDFQ